MSLKRLLNPDNDDGGGEWAEDNSRVFRRHPQSFESESLEPVFTSQDSYYNPSFSGHDLNSSDILVDTTEPGDFYVNTDEISQQIPSSLLLTSCTPSSSTPATEPRGHTEADVDIPITDISVNVQTAQICYGMICNAKVKFVGKGQELEKRVQELNKKGLHVSRVQTFSIRKSADQHLFLTFPDGYELGYLSEKLARAFKDLIDQPSVQLDAIANLYTLSEAIRRAGKPSDAAIRVEINVYGPASDLDRIGGELSDRGLFLQDPDHCRPGMEYDNPHTLRLDGMDESGTDNLSSKSQVDEDFSEPLLDQDEEFEETIVEVFSSLKRGQELHRLEGSDILNKTLFPHQEEALDFMTQRETGNISSEYRLWQPKDNGGEQWYCHSITKATEREQPDESGGGILADEMGMGKSLTTLALIGKTLMDGRKWVEGQEVSQGGIPAKQPTRATLVVVPSLVLINTWLREIVNHLDGSMEAIKYHGPKRKEIIKKIEHFDIVITTYSTLAKEHGGEKGGRNKSPLHNFAWYRVVLDEAHMIRRQATTFHRAMVDLTAKSRWCLSGTPIQNDLSDFGALLAFIQAKPFHNMNTFRNFIANPFTERATKQRAIERLTLLLEALCLRRTIDRVKIPRQKEQTRLVELTPEEREQYEKTKQVMYRSIAHQAGEYNHRNPMFGMFQVFLQLRILCNHGTYQHYFSWSKRSLLDEEEDAVCSVARNGLSHCSGCRQPLPILSRDRRPKYVENCKHILCNDCLEVSNKQSDRNERHHCPLCKPLGAPPFSLYPTNESSLFHKSSRLNGVEGRHGDEYFRSPGCSSKMDALISDVQKNVSTKSIIFSCWTRTLDLIAKHLECVNINFARIDGKTLSPQRQKVLDDFDGTQNIPILIMTTGTGAFGLNLQSVKRVFIVEPQWNPSVESQAIARAIRLGQEQQVLVTRYRVKDSIEEDMCSQQKEKLKLGKMDFRNDILSLQSDTSISSNEEDQRLEMPHPLPLDTETRKEP